MYYKNHTGKALRISGCVIMTIIIIASILMAIKTKLFFIAVICGVAGIALGMVFIGFAEVVYLLDQRNRILRNIEKQGEQKTK